MMTLKPLLVLAASGLLAACVSILPERPVPAALYLIGPVEPVTGLEETVLVRNPEATRAFAGTNMVVEDRGGGLNVIAGARWAGPLTSMMQAGLVEAMSGPGAGVALDDLSGGAGAYELSWRVLELAAGPREARCALRLDLLDARTRVPVASGHVEGRAPLSGQNDRERAEAISAAGEACLVEAARFVADAVAAEGLQASQPTPAGL